MKRLNVVLAGGVVSSYRREFSQNEAVLLSHWNSVGSKCNVWCNQAWSVVNKVDPPPLATDDLLWASGLALSSSMSLLGPPSLLPCSSEAPPRAPVLSGATSVASSMSLIDKRLYPHPDRVVIDYDCGSRQIGCWRWDPTLDTNCEG